MTECQENAHIGEISAVMLVRCFMTARRCTDKMVIVSGTTVVIGDFPAFSGMIV